MIKLSDNVTKLNSLNRRMFILATAKIIILGGIISRLFFLQIKENKKYKQSLIGWGLIVMFLKYEVKIHIRV